MEKNVLLAIESSCDETAAAIMINGKICANIISTQAIHRQYGGVVPELASRDHQKNLWPTVTQAFAQANITKNELNAIAYTKGPGLLGALLVGASFAKSLAYGLDVPLIGVHHMKAHILAHFIEDPKPMFPFLCLTVSGGHTQLVLVESPLNMQIIGQTQDDAVGEAFDKTAKMLGLPYPGGPLIDSYAQKGNPKAFTFPKAQMPSLDFSFSGIKTAILYFVQKNTAQDAQFVKNNIHDICASVQYALVNNLIDKLKQAVIQTGVKHFGIAGGVSANSALRSAVAKLAEELGVQSYIPSFEFCTDNAAMIAMSAHYQYLAKDFESLDAGVNPRMPF